MMILSTFRPAFLPDLNYFWQVSQCQVAIFADHLQFSKGSTINRSAPLNTPNDLLTIPVQHQHPTQSIQQKRLLRDDWWKQKHLKTFHHLFHNFPFAEYYLPQIEAIYQAPTTHLGDFLFHLTKTLHSWLHLPVRWLRSSELTHAHKATTLIIDWCKKLHCDAYLAHQQTFQQNWVEAQALKAQGIEPLIFAPLPPSSFLNNFAAKSILHFILQFGPEAGYILRQYASQKVQSYL